MASSARLSIAGDSFNRSLRRRRLQSGVPKTAGGTGAGKTAEGGHHSGRDASRSAQAFRMGIALARGGATYEEMVEALLADPETAEWVRTKGQENGERELRRIWEKAEGEATDRNRSGVSL